MSEVPDAEPSPDIMQESQDIGFLGVHIPAGLRDLFSAVRGNPAVIAPGAGIALFRFFQEPFRFASRRQHVFLFSLTGKTGSGFPVFVQYPYYTRRMSK